MCEVNKTKKCCRCGQNKKLNKFWKCKKAKDGLNSRCAECSLLKNDEKRVKQSLLNKQLKEEEKLKLKKEKELRVSLIIDKKCFKCGETKLVDDFYKNDDSKDGYFNNCKKCELKIGFDRKEDKFLHKKYIKIDKKVCKICDFEKPVEEFRIAKNGKDGYQNKCKLCQRIHEKELLIKSSPEQKENRNKSQSDWYFKKREEDPTYGTKYDKDKRKVYKDNKRLTDPLFKLRESISNLIRVSITSGGYTKTSRTYQILGCDWVEFKIYIESLWEPWMTWENYGKYKNKTPYFGWDFDHIIPVSTGMNEEEILRLNHYLNFQPLCSYINSNIKNGRLDWDKNNPLN
jgi:hypothetical protein